MRTLVGLKLMVEGSTYVIRRRRDSVQKHRVERIAPRMKK